MKEGPHRRSGPHRLGASRELHAGLRVLVAAAEVLGGARLLHESEGVGQTLCRARSRLYRSQFLQENMRLKALAEIYTTHFFYTYIPTLTTTFL